MSDPRTIFTTAREAALQRAADLEARSTRLGLLRLAGFFVVLALAVYLSVDVHPLAGLPVLVLGLAGFNWLVGQHQRVQEEYRLARRLVDINDGELRSLDYQFDGFDGGVEFQDPQHPFTGDLDVFGEHSVFQLLNRTTTRVGTDALAHYLRHPLQDLSAIGLRQEAVRELAVSPAWGQDFRAIGSATAPATPTALRQLRQWATTPPTLTESYWSWLIPLLSIVNILLLAAFAFFPFYLVLLAYLPTVLLLRRVGSRIDAIYEDTADASDVLRRYSRLIALIEQQPRQSQLLRELRAQFALTGDDSATRALQSLSYDLRQLGLRVNPFVLLLNVFSLWEIRYARRVERWKQHYLAQPPGQPVLPDAVRFALPGGINAEHDGSQLDRWLLSIGAVDALVSVAALTFRYPSWTFPEVTAYDVANPEIVGRGMHHPLLPPTQSVANDFSSAARAHINLLTGSNMAGKSTFLRTVGLQLVFAQAGLPVPATSLQLPLLRVYTSMRTQDNLHRGASAFYAELQRLRIVVEATRRGENVFFLLDEILKGTNSEDRQEGGRALIRQLLRNGAAGIVATHDLELADLKSDTAALSPLRLEVETNEDGELYFDYTLKPGLARSRNASILMRKLGLGLTE